MAHPGRIFRIFASSTFTDLQEERNALQREVFPALKKLCTENDCQFQAIDLRWGVSEEAGLDQRTMNICLGEIERCQEVTPRPNFIVLLGDRYGWQPLPEEIPKDEFEEIEKQVKESKDKELLSIWYKQDDNARQPVYNLQRRTDEFADFNVWEPVEKRIRSIFVDAVSNISLNPDKLVKYTASATEQEIKRGALGAQDISEQAFCFFRTIEGLPQDFTAKEFLSALPEQIDKEYKKRRDDPAVARILEKLQSLPPDLSAREVEDYIRKFLEEAPKDSFIEEVLEKILGWFHLSIAGDFQDFDKNMSRPHSLSQQKLKNLKAELRQALPKENVFEYPAQWTGKGITTDHVQDLCRDVYNSLKKVILSEIKKIKAKPYLEKEIEDHERFGEKRAEFFVGRSSILKKISEYISGKSTHPLGLYGEGGSGKSALMAYALNQARKEPHQAEVVFRFIGATINSSDVRALLEDLCRQISEAYGVDKAIPTTYEDLVQEFPKRLASASADKPLILFLDSLDQLSAAHNAHSLTWLPAELPENVRLITTTRPGEHLIALRNKLPQDHVFELERMSKKDGEDLLREWLKDAGRYLQDFQEKEVLEKFSACGWPLYLKLAFEEARLWKSYTKEIKLAEDTEGIIRDNLFRRLESDHGETLLARCLGYIAATREMMGLAEDELLEILSLDNEFFDKFLKMARHTPPERKLPVAVWSRLYFDLESYLSGKSHEGTALLTFFHRELGEVAHSKYLAKDEAKYQQVLAEYFLSKADPEVDSQTKKRKKTWKGVPRALSEVPFHLTQADRWDELFETMVDFQFLEQKAARVGVQENIDAKGNRTTSYTGALGLLEDYDLALKEFPKE